MILVTGGLGFIGTHTVQALLDAGEECVLVQRSTAEVPAGRFTGPVAVEQADVTDLRALLDVGTRHRVTGIVHLAGSMPWPPGHGDPVEATRTALGGLLNVLRAAREWNVRRVAVASTIGVYDLGAEGALSEDTPLPARSPGLIPTFKRIGELLGGHLAEATGTEIVDLRISGIWGPREPHGPLFFAAPALVHAAARGTEPDLSPLGRPAYAEDAVDLCYVKDAARGIALLTLADRLRHRTYNVASGRATTNAEIIAAIRKAVPDARVDLPTGGTAPRNHLDITRIRQDTGYAPAYDTETAVAEYLAWLRAGHRR